MLKTIKDIHIPAGSVVIRSAVHEGLFTPEIPGVFLSFHQVEEIIEVVDETEPGWNPMKDIPECKPVLILSKGSRVPIPYIGLKNTNGEIVLRDHAGIIPKPAGWKEI